MEYYVEKPKLCTSKEQKVDLEALVDKLEAALLWIAQYDHQKTALDVLIKPPSGFTREAAYRVVLSEVAATDIQAWAKAALAQIQKTKEQGQ